eukprot:6209524-Pleurochrysis_carterae.AAC.2
MSQCHQIWKAWQRQPHIEALVYENSVSLPPGDRAAAYRCRSESLRLLASPFEARAYATLQSCGAATTLR